jgi:hypothetical protein
MCVELLYLLTHTRFEPDEAQKHWGAVIRHREELEDAVGYAMDLSVALVGYFVQVSRKLKNPKVIPIPDSAWPGRLTGGAMILGGLIVLMRWAVGSG